ncbi:DUF1542 domain-containing protein [Bombilactobacillus thymidiniphilus]|uniref:DUF1542 domain-containing protein n=1 Tax=Bombilactobacillus thymidiniphilus TaxID=2923363 RepID=A0ABY4PE06_9LACO|nr:DUF1542 domain-containing protein [Bombilactobacillus thymidiniphilus]UQS84013.1 DUF1542 domain-containing protein [Bombilactobacillus thymidiniphilus]
MYVKKQVLFTMGVTLFSSALLVSTKPKNVAAADVAVPQTVDVVNDNVTNTNSSTATSVNADSDDAVQTKPATDTTAVQSSTMTDTTEAFQEQQKVPVQTQNPTVSTPATSQIPADDTTNEPDNSGQATSDLDKAKLTTVNNLQTQANSAKSIIDQQTDLTTDKKTNYVADIDNIVSEASTNVEQINDQAELTELETQFSLYILQTQAQAQLEQGYVSLSKKHPEQNADLEDVWKQNSDLLDVATTNEAAQKILAVGLQSLNDVIDNPDLATARQSALTQLQDEHTAMINKIQNSGLSSDAQDDFLARADDAYNTAVANVHSATTTNDVQSALTTGEQNITNVLGHEGADDLNTAYNTAINDLNVVYHQALDALDQLTLNEVHQKQLKQQIMDAYQNGFSGIFQAAPDDISISKAEDQGITGLNRVIATLNSNNYDDSLELAQNDALTQLQDEHAAMINKIQNSGLSSDAQDDFLARADDAYNTAVANVHSATTTNDVQSALTTGEQNIINVLGHNGPDALTDAKISALNELASAYNDMIDKIQQSTDMSVDGAAQAQADLIAITKTAYKNAIAAIQSTTTSTEIESALTTGKQNIANVFSGHNGADALTDAKTSAFNELNEVRDQALTTLDQANLAISDKNTLKKAIMDAYKDAYTKIVITNMDGIVEAKEIGVANINKIIAQINSSSADNNLEIAKNDAINALQTARDHDLATVSALNPQVTRDLTANDVNQFTTQINAAFDSAKTAINNANSEADVTAAKTAGINAMNQVVDSAISESNLNTANQSTQEVLDAINSSANTLIDQANISAEDKASFKDQLASFYDTATTKLAGATSLADMTAIKDNFVTQTNQLIATVSAKTLSADGNSTPEETTSTDYATTDPSAANGTDFATSADPAMVSHLISDPAQISDPKDPKASLPQLGEQNNTGWIGWLLLDSVIAMFGFGKSKKRRN